MIRKMTPLMIASIFALLLLACSPTVEQVEETATEAEPVAAVEEEMEEVAEAEDAMMEEEDSEEMAMEEESHNDDMAMEEEDSEEMAMEEDGSEEMVMEDEGSEEMAMEEEAEMAESMNVNYAIVTSDSVLNWKGAKAVGDFHTGTIDITEGVLEVVDGALASGSFVMDMTTMVSTDLSGGMADRLVGHLKSDDFFSVDSFPTAELVITSAEPAGDGQYNVIGDLTIKGITNPIEFVATATEGDGQLTAAADLVFDRALYDVQFGSGSFFSDLGDDLINDEIEISVELVAAK
ncbi:MAG: YceI family protein [Chloroflexota bacterium]